MEERAMEERAMEERAMEERAMEERAMEERAMKRHAALLLQACGNVSRRTEDAGIPAYIRLSLDVIR